ncbi:hypothetical protein BJF78_09480 [Pseudonocardia sp. CNS-139]|nr:hypothetical protein BJF78_09480 [Pseudonocardia sp. CNS-139]
MRVTPSAPTFSSRYRTRLVPGIGTTSSPCPSSHASATWPAVARCPAAMSRTVATSARLRSRFSPWKRGRVLRKSSAPNVPPGSAPVSIPRPSGL